MAWTTPRTWAAGETLTAALLNTHLRDNLRALGDAWTAYTPTWTATVNPAIGNGTWTAAYIQAGKLVHFRIGLTMGSTTTYGSGAWFIGLPVAAHAAVSCTVWPIYGDASPAARSGGSSVLSGSSIYLLTGLFAGEVTATNPITWTTGDTLHVSGVYEAA